MNQSDLVLTTIKNFLDQLGVSEAYDLSVDFSETDDIYQVQIQTQNPGAIIGFHGETLSALQLMISQHLHSHLGVWFNLSINVNDYRQRREITLKSLADAAVSQVLATKTPHSLPPMPSYERRAIHLYLSERQDVVTSSEGVGKKRYIIISPKA